jgi:DNA-binding response OmpR family regulator
MLVLLVEDEKELASLVMEYLEAQGIECDYCDNGDVAISRILEQTYDIIILDINLPGKNGFEVCDTLRAQGINTPCIMLTARHSLDDKATGFQSGADDYLVKPFAMQELVMRLQSLYTRGKKAKKLKVEDLELDVERREAIRGSRVLKLSPDEWRLLLLLVRNAPDVVTKSKIEEAIWPDGLPSSDALKMLTYRLRKQIDTSNDKTLLKTERGIGLSLGG